MQKNLDMTNDSQIVSEICKTLGIKYNTVRFTVKPVYQKRNIEWRRSKKVIPNQDKLLINVLSG